MDKIKNNDDNLLDILKEREKELNCLYKVDEVINNFQLSVPEILEMIIKVIPPGWRIPDECRARIVYKNHIYQPPDYIDSPVVDQCNIKADGKTVGSIEVIYISKVSKTDEGYFLEKERQLLRTIANRIGQMIFFREMKPILSQWEVAKNQNLQALNGYDEWEVIVNFLYHTDQNMLLHICRKMINFLIISGFKEAASILNTSFAGKTEDIGDLNYPSLTEPLDSIANISEKTFRIARNHLGSNEITIYIKKWIQEEKVYSLAKTIGCISPSVRNIIEELSKYQNIDKDDESIYSPKARWLSVSLISRFFSERPEFVNVAKQYINYRDFFDIIHRIIFPIHSQGKLGGKSSGLFLAQKIVANESESVPLLASIKTPKTWYITADAFTDFLQYNNLEELNEQKYKEIQEIRIDYPNIIQLMKNSKMPQDITKSLSVVLDDFGELPLIVRSSSMLEDQVGAAFSGKYKSLFLANRGSKQERLDALVDAVIEVYSSSFSPDSIRYRTEKGLLDFHEEMGIMIQKVVGTSIGPYFFPVFSGVAFSNNEYRWSPRIKREDGLIRMVPGLGTRAVDRLSDDFPVLLSPEQPKIPVNVIPEEIQRYAPKKIDVINLEKGIFETIDIAALLKAYGNQIPDINKIVSIIEFNHIKSPNKYEIDFNKNDLVVTFDGVITKTQFVKQINAMLKTLQEKMGRPVDIEFACDGQDIYILQCRPQSSGLDSTPAPIPKDIAEQDMIFSADRYISNGMIQNISYIVYIDPDGYSSLDELNDMNNIGKIVGLLNTVLPKRQFVLIGPGRWGSRGDIKLGVRVGYSDICHTAALIEVARKKTGYLPELSFGTHFFQDLVEANIPYLPLYPDDEGVIFNEKFFLKNKNLLGEIFPDYQKYEDVIKVVNVPDAAKGRVLRIVMNADLGEAVGYLSDHIVETFKEARPGRYDEYQTNSKSWRWRNYMAERLAAAVDRERFGVKGFYLFGSTNNGTAGPGSDIDLLIHFQGTEAQKKDLLHWLEGWSLSLDEMNYLDTGYRMDGLLDIHIVTDEDIENQDCFAIKINLVSDANALKLKFDE